MNENIKKINELIEENSKLIDKIKETINNYKFKK